MGSNGVSRGRGKLHDPESNAQIRTTKPDHGKGAQHLLGGPEIHAFVGSKPTNTRAEVRCQLADTKPHLQLQERVHPLGRRQRDAPLGLLRAEARPQRQSRLLPNGSEFGSPSSPVHERLQRARDLQRREFLGRSLRHEAARTRSGRGGDGRNRTRRALLHSESGLDPRRAR